ncbi:glyoxalase superfamily protein [Advenella incenata]
MDSPTIYNVQYGRIAPTIPVSDIKRSLAFYSDVLGFDITFTNGDPVGFAILKRGSAEIHLTLHKGLKPQSFNVAHRMVSNVDAFYQVCKSHNVRIIKSLQDKDFGLKAFVFADMDGNRFDVG